MEMDRRDLQGLMEEEPRSRTGKPTETNAKGIRPKSGIIELSGLERIETLTKGVIGITILLV